MVQPFLFIGVGGSGGKTLRAIKQELRSILRSADWDFDQFGFPVIWQFVHIDTPFQQDGEDFPARNLEASEYLGLVAAGTPLDGIIANLQGNGFAPGDFEEIMAPLPKYGQYDKAVDEGAGQYRAIGREVAIARLQQIKNMIRVARSNMNGPEKARQQVALDTIFNAPQGAGGEAKPKVLLVSSLAGGSGSGQILDVAEAVKAAAPNDAWIHDQTALLYAPDVFEDPKITINEGIAPNSLFSSGELVSGKWRRKATDIQEVLYTKFAFANVETAEYNVGPKRILLVGRSNGQIQFSSQNDVYMAAALSIAKWTVDQGVGEALGAYLNTNIQGADEPAMLKVSGLLTYPMNSIGFARVSLGMDYFADYCAGRLARHTVDMLVFGHKSKDRSLTDTAAIDLTVSELTQGFVDKLGIGVQTIRQSICPPSMQSTWRLEVKRDLDRQVGDQTSPRPFTEWVENLASALSAILPAARKTWVGKRETEKWVLEVQAQVTNIVAWYAANHGLLVAHALLQKTMSGLSSYIANQSARPDVSALVTEARNAGRKAASEKGAGTRSGEDPDVGDLYNNMLASAENFMLVEDKAFIAELLKDLSANFLQPLSQEILSKHQLMVNAVEDDNYGGRGINVFKAWPAPGVTPAAPAPNMRLLISHTEFEDHFDKLLQESLVMPIAQAIPQAVCDIVGGSKQIRELSNLDPDDLENNSTRTWQPFTRVRPWNPANGTSKGQARWSGSLVTTLDDWEDIAEKYVRIKGRPLGEEIATNLYKWLNVDDAAIRASRENRLKGEFGSVLAMSKPFAKVNNTLMSLAHGGEGLKFEMVFSDIPVDLSGSSSLGQELKDALVRAQVWNGKVEGAFKGELSKSSTIDVFSTFKSPVHHFVFDNLMNPIIERWGKVRDNEQQRAEFMKFRQGRTLPETIPLAPEILEQVLRGWYVGQLLNRITAEPDQKSRVRIKIHIDPAHQGPAQASVDRGPRSFPYPLLYSRDQIPAYEYAAVVASSISIALADCSNENSFGPLTPYHELMYLGGSVSENLVSGGMFIGTCPELSKWILSGTLDFGAPTPNPERAGEPTGTFMSRRDKAVAFIDKCLQDVDRHVNLSDPAKRHDTLVWQMRRELNSALDVLKKQIMELEE